MYIINIMWLIAPVGLFTILFILLISKSLIKSKKVFFAFFVLILVYAILGVACYYFYEAFLSNQYISLLISLSCIGFGGFINIIVVYLGIAKLKKIDSKEELLRLQHDIEKNMQVEDKWLNMLFSYTADKWTVSGRGELHLSILIETMRREGYELQVSRPEVIVKEIDGVKCEPFERVQIDTPEEYQGSVIQSLSERKGEMLDMISTGNGQTRLVFLVPARGLIGYSTEFLSMTRGYGIMNHTFDQYLPLIPGEIGGRHRGALVSIDAGKATTYSIMSIEERGTIFVNPGTEVYEGMIIGENSRENDLTVNITKAKQMTNVRSATKDQTAVIKTPRILTLEESLEFLNDDEYMEVTPESIRLRKQILNKQEREKANKKKKSAAAE